MKGLCNVLCEVLPLILCIALQYVMYTQWELCSSINVELQIVDNFTCNVFISLFLKKSLH